MQCKFFVIHIACGNAEEENGKMNTFLRNHRILSLRKEFVNNGSDSPWCCCVEYMEGTGKISSSLTTREKDSEQIDYRALLNDQEFSRFLKYKQSRNQLAEKAGVPPYAVFLNAHLAAMAQFTSLDLTAMASIPGIGKSKMEKCGESFLELISETGQNDEACGKSVSTNN